MAEQLVGLQYQLKKQDKDTFTLRKQLADYTSKNPTTTTTDKTSNTKQEEII